ncbi:caspase family protein [Micromonospora sp. NPDC003241]
MPDQAAQQPLVIMLGADTWPAWPDLDKPVIGRSHAAFLDYVRNGLHVPGARVLNLFGSTASPHEMVEKIQGFLDRGQAEATDVIVYYVGHGDRIPDGDEFVLLTACATRAAIDSSSLRASHVAEALRPCAGKLRVHLIIDACFSAETARAFNRPIGSVGVAVLASCSSGDLSYGDPDADTTVFTGALLKVLWRGEPGHARRLCLREVGTLVKDELADRDTKTYPEVHDPEQRKGRISEVPLFPNPPVPPRPLEDHAVRPWCAVVSAADVPAGGTSVGQFGDAIEGFREIYRRSVADETGWHLGEHPELVRSAEVFGSTRSFQEAVQSVCSADLAFFDLTDLEPAVVVLLGMRAVVRRGVTICFLQESEDKHGGLAGVPPFLLRDINVVSFSPGGVLPEDLLGARALAGIRDLSRAPFRYADLPGFDAIRQLPPVLDRTVIPYHERVLVLCSFDSAYGSRNWPEIQRRLKRAVEARRTSRGDGTGNADDPEMRASVRVERTLDMGSARVVSANLLEAIRLTDLCVCDLTGWKPNVLFELGMRLAARPLEPVCIIDGTGAAESNGPNADRLARIAGQVAGLTSLLRVIEYELDCGNEFYYEIVDRHLDMVQELSEGPVRTWVGDCLAVGSLYRVAWQYADIHHEPATASVVEALRTPARALHVSRQRGSSPYIFPATHRLTDAARHSAVEMLRAAWLYLRDAHERGRITGGDLVELRDVGYDLVALLSEPLEPDDRAFSEEVLAVVDDLEREMSGEAS